MKEREGVGAKTVIEKYPFPIVPIKQDVQIQYENTDQLCKGLWMKLHIVTNDEYQVHHQAVINMTKKDATMLESNDTSLDEEMISFQTDDESDWDGMLEGIVYD